MTRPTHYLIRMLVFLALVAVVVGLLAGRLIVAFSAAAFFNSSTAIGRGCQKLGQPVPLSNLTLELNRSSAHPAQANLPVRCSSLSGLE